MDIDATGLIALSCAVLALLVYMMWRSATDESWQKFSSGEKAEWRKKEDAHK